MEEKSLKKVSKGLFFVISAPAGTGKNTLVDRLKNENENVVESVSFTTRDAREGEVNGKDYFFISKESFLQKQKEGQFLESAEVFGNYYGTSREWIESKQNLGKHVVLVIDTQGAMKLKESFEAIFIFVMPPSVEELRKRLLNRNTDKMEEIEKRLQFSEEEMKKSSNYDYVFVNDDLDVAYDTFRSIFIAEDHKVRL